MPDDLSRPRKNTFGQACFYEAVERVAYHGQACAQCYNAAVERVCLQLSSVRAVLYHSSAYHGHACAQCYNAAVGRGGLPLSGVRAVLERSSRAGVLTIVRRARSVRTLQSGGFAYHGQPCAQCYNAAVGRVCLPWSGVRAVL